jgi:hypothetical protein
MHRVVGNGMPDQQHLRCRRRLAPLERRRFEVGQPEAPRLDTREQRQRFIDEDDGAWKQSLVRLTNAECNLRVVHAGTRRQSPICWRAQKLA